ncbi:MAG: hypothetical protein AAB552_01070 [Patescibacteria group bacterium]
MKRLINPMEMVRAVVRGEVGNTSFIVYAVIFVLSALLGVYMTYTDLVTDSSEMFAFSGGDTAYATLSLVSIAVYFLAPAMLAWKKMSFREYIKYFICLDIPLTVVAFLAIIIFVFINIILLILGVLPMPLGDTPPPMSFGIFSTMVVVVMGLSLMMPYFMKKAIDLRDKKQGETL